jgi:hypothetical protein
MSLLSWLKAGKSKHPQIWMVTGIQMLSNATVYSDRTGSAKTGASVQDPMPELASAVLVGARSDGKLAEAAIPSSKGIFTNVEYQDKKERVWAAQFLRLNLDSLDGDTPRLGATEHGVSIDELLELGRSGMKGGQHISDEKRRILGLSDEYITREDGDSMMEHGEVLEKLKTASGKHALLIGGSERSLNGVRTDLSVMADLLLGRGFHVSSCYGSEATRAGIINSWDRIITRIPECSEDAVVVYYPGHGGASEPEDGQKAQRIQYILPFDIEDTTTTDFRGILLDELSHFVNRLTRRTPNVTIITDCCYSKRIARDGPEEGLRAWAPLTHEAIDEHVQRLDTAGFYKTWMLPTKDNKDAVRLVAAESDSLAFEGDAPPDVTSRGLGRKMGRRTRQLVLELTSIGNKRITWDVLLSQLRLKLEGGEQSQVPTIEGLRSRILFSLDRLDSRGRLRVRHAGTTITVLGGGVLAGVRDGDEYAIMPWTASWPDPNERIAVAEVTGVWQTEAVATLRDNTRHEGFPEGAVAFPIRRPGPDHCVEILIMDARLKSDIKNRLGPFCRVENHHQKPFVTIKQDGNKLILDHGKDDPVLEYSVTTDSAGEDAVSDLIFQIEKLIKADQLLKLAPVDRRDTLDDDSVLIEVEHVRRGLARRWQGGDGQLRVKEGQSVHLIITNEGNTTLYASVFLVTSMGTIEWLSHGNPSGAELREGSEYAPGQTTHGQRHLSRNTNGLELEWPASVSRRGPLDEAFVVVLTNGKADLGFWETAQRTSERDAVKEVEGDYQDKRVPPPQTKFCVKRIDFKLVPK